MDRRLRLDRAFAGRKAGGRMEETFDVMRRFARGQNLRLAGAAQTLIDVALQASDLDPTLP